MILQIIILIILGTLTAFVAGNNISVSVGAIVGSRVVSRYFGLLLCIAGLVAGLVTEGGFLSDSLSRVMPQTNVFILTVLVISTLMFMIASIVRVPLSLIMAIMGTALGVALRNGYNFDSSYVTLVILAWIVAPPLSIVGSYLLNKKLGDTGTVNVWRSARLYKVMLIVLSVVTSFSLGANTFGLLSSINRNSPFTVPVMVVAIILGALFLSRGVMKRVGQDVYSMRYRSALVSLLVSSVLVEVATFLSLPLSGTQTMTSSVFGTGLAYKTKVMESRSFIVIVFMWVLSPLLGMSLGFIIS